MKKIFASSLLLISVIATAQISEVKHPDRYYVGKIEKKGIQVVSLSYTVENSDSSYILQYINAEYKHVVDIKGIAFLGTNGAVESLYKSMKAALKLKDDDRNSFQLGFDNISLSSFKDDDGVRKVFVYVNDKGYFTLSEKEIDKLFGKK